MFSLVASVILFLTGFEVWGDMEGPFRAVVFALAFWQVQLALGWAFPFLADPFTRK